MKKPYAIVSLCLLALLVIFFTSNPLTAPSLILVLPFVLLGIIVYSGLSLLLSYNNMAPAKARRVAILATGLPMIVLVLQSLGQLTVRDVVSISVVFVLAYFYISRMTATSTK
jgi:fructose-specific phosphotransferase system IIC component